MSRRPPGKPIKVATFTFIFTSLRGHLARLVFKLHSLQLCGAQALDDLFLPPPKGAGLSCLRVPLGSSDFALPPAYTPQDNIGAAFDATRDTLLVIPLLQKAGSARCL